MDGASVHIQGIKSLADESLYITVKGLLKNARRDKALKESKA